jgi:hypothetical protein
MTVNTAISQDLDIIARLIAAAFIIIMAAMVFRHLGPNTPILESLSNAIIGSLTPTDLAYTAGAWWLIRKAG